MRLFGLKLNSLLVIAVAALLALGAISAFADSGPPDPPGDGVTVDDGDTDGEGEGHAFGRGHGQGKPEGVPLNEDETDGDVGLLSNGGGDGGGAGQVAEVIATTFDVPVDEVTALRESGIGFGAIFKLYMLDAAGDGTLAALESSAEGDGGFGFGKLFKESADGVSALTAGEDGMPKNLGQAKKAQK